MEPADPALERSFRGHRGGVNAVAFSPSMKQLVTGSDDGAVMVWHFRPQLRAFRFLGDDTPPLAASSFSFVSLSPLSPSSRSLLSPPLTL